MKQDNTPNRHSGMLWRSIFFPLAFIYMELLFHIAIYRSADSSILHPLTFALACGLTLSALTSFWHRYANAAIAYLLWSVFTIYYIAQFVYYKIFRTFLSLVSIGGAQDAMNFRTVLFSALRSNWYIIVLFLLPLICLIIMNRFWFSFGRCRIGQKLGVLKTVLVQLGISAAAWVLAICILAVHGTAAYTPYALFHGRYVLELSMNKLGVIVTTGRDCVTMVTQSSQSKTFELADIGDNQSDAQTAASDINTAFADETDFSSASQTGGSDQAAGSTQTDEPVYVPQVDESIDFQSLYNQTDDEELKSLTAYFSGVQPTYTDEYTGMFEGYNVVFVTAESLSTYGISREATPTLYKIYHEGFEFTNFYNPLWYHSTIDGEYTNCLSQYPASSKWSFEASADTYQPYASAIC